MTYSLAGAVPRLALRGIVLLVTVALALAGARPALAHAELVISDPPANAILPAAPERITLTFSESVEPGFTQAQVLDAQRQRVDKGDARLSDDRHSLSLGLNTPFPDGTYLVSWRALSSVDGHITAGSFPFTIGKTASGSSLTRVRPASSTYVVRPFEVIGRFLHLAGAIVVTGSGIFALVVALPYHRKKRGRGGGLTDEGLHGFFTMMQWLLRAGVAALALAAIVSLADQAAKLDVSMLRVLTETRLGTFLLARMVLILGLAVALARPWPRPSSDNARLPRVVLTVTCLGALLLLSTSLTSHAAAQSGPTAMYVLSDWLHLLAASAWTGGLTMLAVARVFMLTSPDPVQRAELLGGVITRFHVVALVSVGVLIGTGVINSLTQLGGVSDLLTTGYGNVLLAKLGLLLPMLALAAMNALWARPRIIAAARARLADAAATLERRFRVLVRVEALMGILVVAVAALLVTMPPAAGQAAARAAAQNLQMTQWAEDLRITLSISPGRPGLNTFEVAVKDVRDAPLTTPAQVTLNFQGPAADVAVSTLDLQPVGQGMYRATGGNLISNGKWSVEMFVRRADALDARSVFSISVAETIPASAFASSRAASARPTPPLVELRAGGVAFSGLWVPGMGVGIGLVMAGLLALVFWSLNHLRLRPVWAILAGLFLFILATASWANAFGRQVVPVTSTPELLAPAGNPVAPTPDSIAAGQHLYQANCQQCHGATGRGDGPAASELPFRPADLHQHVPLHSDGQLFYFISEGLFGTPMQPFKDELSEDERWALINYLRSAMTPNNR